jgi:hypothetical protein
MDKPERSHNNEGNVVADHKLLEQKRGRKKGKKSKDPCPRTLSSCPSFIVQHNSIIDCPPGHLISNREEI